MMANFEFLANFMKITEFTLAIIFVILAQKWQFRLKNESFEISRKCSYPLQQVDLE